MDTAHLTTAPVAWVVGIDSGLPWDREWGLLWRRGPLKQRRRPTDYNRRLWEGAAHGAPSQFDNHATRYVGRGGVIIHQLCP